MGTGLVSLGDPFGGSKSGPFWLRFEVCALLFSGAFWDPFWVRKGGGKKGGQKAMRVVFWDPLKNTQTPQQEENEGVVASEPEEHQAVRHQPGPAPGPEGCDRRRRGASLAPRRAVFFRYGQEGSTSARRKPRPDVTRRM